MRDEHGGAGPGDLARRTGRLVDEWLLSLEESGDSLLGSYSRVSLRRAMIQSISGRLPAPAVGAMSLPEGTLRLAAQSLRDLLRHLDPADSDSDEARQCVMLACEQILGGNGDAAGDGRHSAAMTPAAALAEAADKIRRAGTSLSVRRTAVDAAARICEAATAVWWDQQDPSSLALAAARGPKLPTEARAFTLTPSFWKSAAAREGVVTLSPDVEEHRGLLAAVNASRGVVVRAGVGARTVGVLGVFSGVYDDDRVDLLLALAQHAAVASHALTLGAEQRQLAEVQQRLVSELGFALSSALSLEELLDLICRSAIELLGADGSIVYLAGPENEFHLRAASSRELISSVGATLDQFAQQTRAQPLGRPLWRTSARGIGGLAHRSILGLVLSVRGDPLGALILLSKRPSAFSQAQREIMISFAAQAAVAVENIQLIEDMQRRLLEMADLTWVSTRITSTMEIERIAATVADAAGKALDAPRTALFVVNEAGEYVPVSHGQRGLNGEPREPLPSAGHLGHEALAMGVPQVVSDALREERADDPLVRWLGVRSLLCVPMVAQQGLRGILVIGDEKARDFPSHAVALLSAYANQTALALQSAMLYQDVVRHLKQLENLFGVSQTLASSLELTQTLDRVLNAAADLVDAPVGTLRLVDPDTEELIIKAARGIRPDHEFYRPLKLGEGLAGKAAQSASPLVSVDISRDGRFTHRDHAREGGLQAAIAAPLITRGRTLGVINLYRRSARPFGDDDTQLVMAFANSAAVAIENARLYEETQERAQFLTAMVSEINHRVRNTLQAVAGLLRMEMDQQPPRSIREVLRRGIARLQSVAVVHDMLQTRDLRFVDIKHAARRIVQLTCQAAAPGADVETKVSGARVMLPSQQATNVAMILSELVDNACRHGLPGTADARILVSLAEGGGNVVIEVKDNGKGLPGNFDLERNSGLGFRLVRGLVEEELGGSLDVQTDNGLTVRAKFPKRL